MAGYIPAGKKWSKWLTNPGFMLILRLFLGCTFLVSGISKLFNQADFVSAVVGYNLLPHVLAVFYGSVLPWVELLIGILLSFGWLVKLASGISLAMVVSFIVASIQAIIMAHFNSNCGCFGNLINMGHTTSLALNIAMLCASLHLLLTTKFSGLKTCQGKLAILKLVHSVFPYASKVVPVILAITVATPTTFFLPGGHEAQASSSVIINTPKSPLYTQINDAFESGKKAFLYFYREGCHYCEEQAPIIDKPGAGLLSRSGVRTFRRQ
jgi:uncharacterized membrane protein YphA (DoxX/SURF4 family)